MFCNLFSDAGHENQGALLWELNSPFKVDEIDVGDPVANEVQIRVHAAGMCHSDYHLTTGATPIALPALGGKAIADGTSRVHAGSTEAAPMNLLGTFAPYMTVHKDSVVKIDPVAYKRDQAVKFGATHVYPSMAEAIAPVLELTHGFMAEKTIIAVGEMRGEYIEEALILTAKTGTCVVTGMGAMADVDVKLNLFLLTICRRR